MPPAVSPEAQLRAFIGKFAPPQQKAIRAARRALRQRFPTANELVYDNYNFFVIGYSPTLRPSDAIVSLTATRNGLGLCFVQGASLPDPKQLLLGSGRQTRFIRLPSPEVMAQSDVNALIRAAIRNSDVPLPKTGKRVLVIRSVSAQQRRRR